MTPWLRKLVWWLHRRRREETLNQELEFHLAEEAEERRGSGMTDADAAWAARRDLGNVTRVREDTRRLWTWAWLEQIAQDLRFAFRMMRRAPMFTAMAMLTLALGIGANTAIFSFMDAILLRSLPVHEPDSLVVVTWRSRPFAFGDRVAMTGVREFVMSSIDGATYPDKSGVSARIFPFPAFERLHEAATPVMSSLFAHHPANRLNIVANGEADIVRGHYVSGEFFSGLGVTPAAGRPILNDDDRPSAAPVAVLSMGYARRRFGDPAAAISRQVRINNVSFTIVGVAPEEFFGVNPNAASDVYLPLHAGEVSPAPDSYWLEMMGRVRPGVDLTQAQHALAPVFQQWVATTAKNDRQRQNLPQLRFESGAGGIDPLRRRYSKPLNVLMAMVGLILASACANLANLLLARAAARRREMAVRLGIGAGRLRLLRQLLTESVCLAGVSGAVAIPIAFASMQLLSTLLANGQQESFTLHAELNWRVLLVTLGLSLTCGIVFGLAPAIQSTRPEVMPALKNARVAERGAHLALGLVRAPLTKALVVIQIAISLLLLVAAGLFVRTLSNLESIRLGFNPDRVLLFDVNAQQAGHGPGEIASFYADLRERLVAVPGVQNVTMSRTSLVRAGMGLPLAVNGQLAIGTRLLNVGPSFLTSMGIPLVEGREIDEHDVPGRPTVAVVNELFARTYIFLLSFRH